MKYAAWTGFILLAFVLLPWASHDGLPSMDSRGGIMIVASQVGAAAVPLLLGCFGLFYKSNRFLGFVVVSIAVIVLEVWGAVA